MNSIEGDRRRVIDSSNKKLKDEDSFQEEMLSPKAQLEREVREAVAAALAVAGVEPSVAERLALTPVPKHQSGDVGFACHELAKVMHRSPVEIARDLAEALNKTQSELVAGYEAVGPFVNIHINYEQFGTAVAIRILEEGPHYGSENIGQGAHIVIDMSSPNIAKRMSIGHLRSTIIGDSLAKIYDHLGYRVTKDNHIGDWGTQYGLLMYAIELWGDLEAIAQNPITELQKLYVKVNDAADPKSQQYADLDPAEAEQRAAEVKNQGRLRFKALESGDPQARHLWQQMVDWSMSDFQRIYDILNVQFDITRGESFYEPMLQDTIQTVRDSRYIDEDGNEVPVAIESKGALVVKFNKDREPAPDSKDRDNVAIIQTSDGRSQYMTRDIATALNRSQELQADGMIYVVGADQKNYFEQFFEILRRMGYAIADQSKHVYFGMVTLPEGKMSTRKGRVILLEDVINEGIQRESQKLVEIEKSRQEKGRELLLTDAERDTVIRQVAIGALKWNDLKADPRRSIVFDWDEMLKMDGNSAPYVQYMRARAISLMEQGHYTGESTHVSPTTDSEKNLVNKLAEFPEAVKKAGETYNPSTIANYVFELAQLFSQMYHEVTVLGGSAEERQSRLTLSAATAETIKTALGLLGIESPDHM